LEVIVIFAIANLFSLFFIESIISPNFSYSTKFKSKSKLLAIFFIKSTENPFHSLVSDLKAIGGLSIIATFISSAEIV
jgi:hypothetical protein